MTVSRARPLVRNAFAAGVLGFAVSGCALHSDTEGLQSLLPASSDDAPSTSFTCVTPLGGSCADARKGFKQGDITYSYGITTMMVQRPDKTYELIPAATFTLKYH